MDSSVSEMDFNEIVYPRNTKTLEIDANFNLNDDWIFPLPPNVESLHFSCHTYAALHSIMSLTRLSTLSFSPYTVFNGEISYLPDTLTSLTMPAHYNGTLFLPFNLKMLDFPKNAQFSRYLVIPKSIEAIQLPDGFDCPLDLSGCSLLQSFDVPPFIGVPLLLPLTLRVLRFHKNYNQRLPNQWPSSLHELRFDSSTGHFNLEMNKLPKSLKIVSLSSAMAKVPNFLFDDASNLEQLFLGTAFSSAFFTKPLQLQRLTELRFGDMFNHPIINSQKGSLLPANLKKLSFGRHFNQSLPDGALPSRLQEIELGGDFTQAFSACKFPSTLTRLRFGEHFDMDISASDFPSHLKEIELHQNFDSLRQKPQSNNWRRVTTWI